MVHGFYNIHEQNTAFRINSLNDRALHHNSDISLRYNHCICLRKTLHLFEAQFKSLTKEGNTKATTTTTTK